VATTPLPANLQPRDLIASYQAILDALSSAYWEASDLASKDLIYGVEQSIGDIITTLTSAQVENLTKQFIALTPKITATNTALQKIKDQVNQITKNIGTASTLVAGISKILSLFPL
jgi:hypothetical protein